MREIKFRAWDNDKMMMVRSLHNTHSQVNIRAELCDPAGGFGTGKPAVTSEVIVNNLMQYTGLHDKNGVEIYEGDIVSYGVKGLDNIGSDKLEHQLYGQVKWEQGSCCWWLVNQHMGVSTHYEVIGNIYENPELVK